MIQTNQDGSGKSKVSETMVVQKVKVEETPSEDAVYNEKMDFLKELPPLD